MGSEARQKNMEELNGAKKPRGVGGGELDPRLKGMVGIYVVAKFMIVHKWSTRLPKSENVKVME